ncbi:hypothetical protein ACIF80_36010 [Streptomyces sp. NPDC085927]|uniref:hypothetical protein n=1 Tax=Streptomyces sp. NPDC085927 TaxID=3365738 RepID=UPI0037D184D3
MAQKAKFTMKAGDQRRLERHVQAEAQRKLGPAASAQVRSEVVKMLNGMCREFEGRPVDEVKAELVNRYALVSGGGSITDPELTQYAEEIARGGSFNA